MEGCSLAATEETHGPGTPQEQKKNAKFRATALRAKSPGA
jgi:hypothetical protein